MSHDHTLPLVGTSLGKTNLNNGTLYYHTEHQLDGIVCGIRLENAENSLMLDKEQAITLRDALTLTINAQ